MSEPSPICYPVRLDELTNPVNKVHAKAPARAPPETVDRPWPNSSPRITACAIMRRCDAG
jgi:hypothetical protein